MFTVINYFKMNRKHSTQILIKKAEESHWICQQNWPVIQEQENLRQERNELRQTIERCALQWFVRGKKSDLLLATEFLVEAEQFYLESADRLSFNARQYIIFSIEAQKQPA